MAMRPLVAAAMIVCAGLTAHAGQIPVQKLAVQQAGTPGRVEIRKALPGEIKEVTTDLVSMKGPAKHVEAARQDSEVVWLFLGGKGGLKTKDKRYVLDGETIARAPLGWGWEIEVAKGEVLHALRVRKQITEADKAELKKYPENNAAPHVMKFSDCPKYGEAIKSKKTVSRTLLPENFVPRMAMGTVETTGPDVVGAHKHPMLEQLFLGLRDNGITVIADEARANLTPFTLLHIPLGSMHGAEVAEGKKLHYVWMDFFATKEGQEWLKTHKPETPAK
jgi:hypothetical protein